MHIVSWNVASWPRTVELIKEHHGSLAAWISRHAIDILCLQEVKGSLSKLEASPGQYGATLEDFDCFFALAKNSTSQGMNGVATFARKGLTRSANGRPFGLDVLDDQGRCIETDHGHFVIINVYMPHEGAFARQLGEKMIFLLRVRRRILALEKEGRRVVLLGDLNLKMSLLDAPGALHCVHVPSLVALPVEEAEPACLDRIRQCLTRHPLSEFKQALDNKVAREWKSDKVAGRYQVFLRNVETGVETHVNPGNTWGLDEVNGSGNHFCLSERRVEVHESEDEVDWPGLVLDDQGRRCWQAFTEDSMWLCDLLVALPAVFGLDKFSDDAWHDLCAWLAHKRLLQVSPRPSLAHWVNTLGLVDVFRFFFPHARHRWTVFSQHTNARYSNHGTKLDYILVSEGLKGALVPPRLPLAGCVCPDEGPHAPGCDLDGQAALRAATANGLWRQAPFEGGGIPVGSTKAFEHQFRPGGRSTGIIYTPPSFSDHIAVSVELELPPQMWDLSADARTKACRTYLRQKKITDLFKVVKKTAEEEEDVDEERQGAEEVPDAGVSGGNNSSKRPKTIVDHFSKNKR